MERTWGLLAEIPSRKAEFYGDKFVWKQYMRVDGWFQGLFVHWGLVWASVILALLPPVRSLLKGLVTQPGGGADRQARSKELLEYRGIAVPDDEETTKKAFAKARYDGSPYVCELLGRWIAIYISMLIPQSDGHYARRSCSYRPAR